MFEATKRWEVKRRNASDDNGVYYMSDTLGSAWVRSVVRKKCGRVKYRTWNRKA